MPPNWLKSSYQRDRKRRLSWVLYFRNEFLSSKTKILLYGLHFVSAQEKRAAQLIKFKDGTEANKKFKELFMEEKYEEVAKLFLPPQVVQTVKNANDVRKLFETSLISYFFI